MLPASVTAVVERIRSTVNGCLLIVGDPADPMHTLSTGDAQRIAAALVSIKEELDAYIRTRPITTPLNQQTQLPLAIRVD